MFYAISNKGGGDIGEKFKIEIVRCNYNKK